MLNLDYPDPKIPGPQPPRTGHIGRQSPPCGHQHWSYRAYAWLLDPEQPWTAVFCLYVGLLFCVGGALDDWRWFSWGVMLPVIAAATIFVAVFVLLAATRFILRLLT